VVVAVGFAVVVSVVGIGFIAVVTVL